MLLKKLISLMRNIVCILGLICVAPFLILASLALFIEDGLPIFFIQDRLGKNQKKFQIIKIRTLKNATPHIGTHELDSRHQLVVGRVIRKIKLDEFPQLINVIKGDINLIGPRPGLPNQHLLLQNREQRGVFNIKPGVTGLAQVMGYDMSNPEELSRIDEMYASKRSFYINTLILMATFISLPKKYLSKIFNIDENHAMQ
tara:strand:+ start:558 stop:1157 length:600 start_codon:yes stop_codon:yes gene_type:complete